jgi:hypothetical protein
VCTSLFARATAPAGGPRPSLLAAAPLAAAHVGFMVLTNLSLRLNPVFLYQVLKVAATPVVCIIQNVSGGRKTSRRGWVLVAIVCAGVSTAVAGRLVAAAEGRGVGVADTVGLAADFFCCCWFVLLLS